MALKRSGLDVWLESGKKVIIGGREFLMMPLPLSRLREAMEAFDERTKMLVKDFVISSEKSEMDIIKFSSDVLNSFNSTDLVYKVLTMRKHPDTGEQLNKGLTVEWLEDNLDLPTIRRFIVDFMELNEIEDAVKKLQGLPGLGGLLDAMTMTYGVSLLKSSQRNTDSLPDKSEISQSPKLTDTSNPATSVILESASGTTNPTSVTTEGPISSQP